MSCVGVYVSLHLFFNYTVLLSNFVNDVGLLHVLGVCFFLQCVKSDNLSILNLRFFEVLHYERMDSNHYQTFTSKIFITVLSPVIL